MSILNMLKSIGVQFTSKLHAIKEGTVNADTTIAPPLSPAEYYVVGYAIARRYGGKEVEIDAARITRVLWFPPQYIPAGCSCWYLANAKGKPVAMYSPAQDWEN